MKVTVQKLTDEGLLREANEFTMGHKRTSKQTLKKVYATRHSPKRTQIFVVRMYGIPSFVSTHLVRHAAVGQQHYVESNRPDLGGDDNADRHTPVDHMMILNAQHIQEMSWMRLCRKASPETRGVLYEMRRAVRQVDPDLAEEMLPYCKRHGFCDEPKSCGLVNTLQRI